MMISYDHMETKIGPVVRVLLDGESVGMILRDKRAAGGFFYVPKTGLRGATFQTVEDVKRSLEN